MTVTAKPNRRGARSRELVLDAAERVMAEEGFEAATLARIVDESGIPISSVYHYFGSKDGVLLAVMERGAQRFFAQVRTTRLRQGEPADHLARVIDDICRTLEQESDFLVLVVTMAVQPPSASRGQALRVVHGIRRSALDRLGAEISVALGIPPGEPTVVELARFALATIDGAFVARQADAAVRLRDVLRFLPVAIVAAAGREVVREEL